MSMNFLRSAPGMPTVPPPFTLSRAKRTHTWQAYLWPFQSGRECIVMLRVFAVGLLLCSVMVWLWVTPEALPYTLAGGLAGGLWLGPYRSLPGRMTIITRSEARYHLGDLEKLLMKRGFVRSAEATEPGHHRYIHPRPQALLLPLYVAGQTFDLRVCDHTIHLQSQIRWIEWMHAQLARQLKA